MYTPSWQQYSLMAEWPLSEGQCKTAKMVQVWFEDKQVLSMETLPHNLQSQGVGGIISLFLSGPYVPGEILVEPDWVFVIDHKHIHLPHRKDALSLKFNTLIMVQGLMCLTIPIQCVLTSFMCHPKLYYLAHQLELSIYKLNHCFLLFKAISCLCSFACTMQ